MQVSRWCAQCTTLYYTIQYTVQKKPIGDQYDLNIDVSLEQAEALKSASIW